MHIISAAELAAGTERLQPGDRQKIFVDNLPGGAIENLITVAKVGGDFTTFAAAMTAASPGDLILVYPGTYIEDNPLPSVTNVAIVALGERGTTQAEDRLSPIHGLGPSEKIGLGRPGLDQRPLRALIARPMRNMAAYPDSSANTSWWWYSARPEVGSVK